VSNTSVSVAYYEACSFMERRGHAPFAGKLLTERVGPWTLCLNGTKETVEMKPEGSMGWCVGPFSVAVFYLGWAAGELARNGGWFAAGSEANEAAFIAAMERADEEDM